MSPGNGAAVDKAYAANGTAASGAVCAPGTLRAPKERDRLQKPAESRTGKLVMSVA